MEEISESASPNVGKRISETSQGCFSRTSFTSKSSASQKRDSSIIQIEAKAYGVVRKRLSTGIFRLGRRDSDGQWKTRLRKRLDGVTFTLASMLFTMMILYADLIKTAVAPASLDPYFLAFTITAITIFSVEIILSSLCRPGYFFRFYFWMDLVASFSLLCDIPSFVDLITFDADDSNRHLTLDRISKAAQAGARAARIMQVISVLQLLHLRTKRSASKLMDKSLDRALSRSTSETDSDHGGIQFQMTSLKPQSRVGEKLTEKTMRKVILGVLLLLSMLPVFDSWVFYGTPTSFEDGGLLTLHNLYMMEGNSSSFMEAVHDFEQQNVYKVGGRQTGHVIELKIHNLTFVERTKRINELRKSEKQSSVVESPVGCNVVDGSTCGSSMTLVDVRWDLQFQAMLDIARVTFLLMVLSLGAVLFIRDADSLVLQPIERMVHKVRLMSENPLSSKNFAIESRKDDRSKQLETRILERSIGKVCQLLSVGFGEAGAEIIANNIKSGGDINPMLPGKRVEAIFGFCDIRNFTAATEVLQEDIMEFVNCIASVVHAEVSFHGGAANKNIGDAFLVVWKLPEPEKDEKFRRPRGSIIEAKSALMWGSESHADLGQGSSNISRHYADAALAAMIIIQQSIDRSTKLKDFCHREDIQARMPGFSVNLGFGLHVGWAIEGAIGSHHKIDPSYLSPHVNMASRLEAATKQYGVPILLSDTFFALLSPQAQQKCRPIDTVMVKGSAVPTTIFTVKAVFGIKSKLDNKNCDKSNPRSSFKVESNAVEVEGGHVSFSDYPYLEEFDEHPDLLSLHWMVSDDEKWLLTQFHDAYESYIDGEWKRSMSLLEPLRHHDGPSRSLFEFMHCHGGSPPAFWNGCRELTEK